MSDSDAISNPTAHFHEDNGDNNISLSSASASSNKSKLPVKVHTNKVSTEDFDFNSFSKQRTQWTANDDETLDRLLQQVQGCSKLVSLANWWYRRMNKCITVFNAISVSLLTVLTSHQLYNSTSAQVSPSWISALSTIFSILKLFTAGLAAIFQYTARETKCIQLEDSCSNLYESVRNIKATPAADRLSPTIVLQKIIKQYLSIRRGMLKINIFTDQSNSYRKEVNALKNRSDAIKDVYLSVVDDFGAI